VQRGWEAFRAAARALLASETPPEQVVWEETDAMQPLLPELLASSPELGGAGARVPRSFVALGEVVILHRDTRRMPLLYQALWRLTHDEPGLLSRAADPLLLALRRMAADVEKDVHRIHAFVRFRRVEDGDGVPRFIAWHRPEHGCLRRAVWLFQRRFASMRWSILTPDESVHWDGEALRWAEGAPRDAAPDGDALEALWGTYYASVFNPARVNRSLLLRHLPPRHWPTLPESELIPGLLRDAPARAQSMIVPVRQVSASEAFIPEGRTLDSLGSAARSCTACPLHARATQTVFGEGLSNAAVMLVGEQPGDLEDRRGKPFVGPAGQKLDEVLADVGLPRSSLYVTNAVKHFGWTGDEKRRIHAKPGTREIHACRGWLRAEVEALRPRILVALGATAGQAFLGPGFRLARSRGQVFRTPWAPAFLATWHPSALLRMPDPVARARAEEEFREDLRRAVLLLRSGVSAGSPEAETSV